MYQPTILCDSIGFLNIDFIPAHHKIAQEAEELNIMRYELLNSTLIKSFTLSANISPSPDNQKLNRKNSLKPDHLLYSKCFSIRYTSVDISIML